MTNFIPIFPLEIVVFPGEQLNLHVIEPRYTQLMADCAHHKKHFGIPVVIEGKIKDFGCLVQVCEIARTHENGEMDVKTKGERVFRILELIDAVPDKLYSGAIVNYPDNQFQGKDTIMQALVAQMKDLHRSLKLKVNFPKDEGALTAYDIAHHSGLTLQQEYELLQLVHERQRQEYLKRHFEEVKPKLAEIQKLKEKIQRNGHFKELKSLF